MNTRLLKFLLATVKYICFNYTPLIHAACAKNKMISISFTEFSWPFLLLS